MKKGAQVTGHLTKGAGGLTVDLTTLRRIGELLLDHALAAGVEAESAPPRGLQRIQR